MPPEKVIAISKAHRFLNLCVLAYLITAIALAATQNSGPAIYSPLLIAFLVVVLLSAIAVVRLASTLYHPVVTVILALLVLVPVIGGLILLMSSDRASKALKKAGYQVSFLGSIKQ